MNEKCTSACQCDRRQELVRDILRHDSEQVQANLLRSGSYWGICANASLMALSRRLLTDYVLNDSTPLDEAMDRTNDYLQTDLRIFTLEAEGLKVSQMDEVRALMQEQVKVCAMPVLQAIKDKNVQGVDDLVIMLQSAAVKVMTPNVDSGDFAAVLANSFEEG